MGRHSVKKENWILLVTAGGPTEDKPHTHFVAPEDKNRVSHSFTIRVKDCKNAPAVYSIRGAVSFKKRHLSGLKSEH